MLSTNLELFSLKFLFYFIKTINYYYAKVKAETIDPFVIY